MMEQFTCTGPMDVEDYPPDLDPVSDTEDDSDEASGELLQ